MDTEDPMIEITQDLVEQVLWTAMVIDDILKLPSIDPDARPGQGKTEVLLSMIVGTCIPASRAAGEDGCRMTRALVGALRERVLADLRVAGEPPAEREERERRGE